MYYIQQEIKSGKIMAKNQGRILIVDDNEEILVACRLFLRNYFEMVHTENNPVRIPERLNKETYDVILLDMNFKAGINTGNEGFYWMQIILKIDPNATIIFMTAYADVELAVKAIKSGATDFIEKPWEDEKLLTTVLSAYKLHQSKSEITNLKVKQKHLSEKIDQKFNMVVGKSTEMQKIFNTIQKVAKTDANIMILGENGTGKEIIAREIHRQSTRSNEVFINVDMGAIPQNLFESELFGHVKGAFTDAKEDRAGRFEIATGGSLFLDEIGNLSLPLQAKLLTVLQNRVVTRVGSNKSISFDIRLISATNMNIEEMVETGNFREDLLYRINTIQIELPPLRKRKEDIPHLSNFFLEKYGKKYKKENLKISTHALDKLINHRWRGNIRELQHVIEKGVILCENNILHPDDFFFNADIKQKRELPASFNLEENEKNLIKLAIIKNEGNLSRTGRELGISRKTLYNKLNKYDL